MEAPLDADYAIVILYNYLLDYCGDRGIHVPRLDMGTWNRLVQAVDQLGCWP